MRGLFDFDSPLVQKISRLADLVLLNLFMLFCSLPVITFGAAQTALYDVVERMARKEEYSLKGYWKALKENFRKATVLWLMFLVGGLLLAFSLRFYLSAETTAGQIALVVQGILCFFWAAAFSWVFPMQARFENTIKNSIYNAFHCAASFVPRTCMMVLLNSLPAVLFFTAPPWFVRLGPLWIFLWFSSAAYINAFLVNRPFSIMIEKATGAEGKQESDSTGKQTNGD